MNKSGFNQRLVAYVAAAVLTAFIGEGDNLRHAAGWVDFVMIFARVALNGVIVWRAFIDQSKALLTDADKQAISKSAATLVGIVGVALLLSGCAVTIPLGTDAQYGRITVGYEPPPSLYALADAPAGTGINDFKEVLR
jgi:hypothetical protein